MNSTRDLSSSDSDYPPTRYEDLKGGTITTVTTFSDSRDGLRPELKAGGGGALPVIAGSVPGQAVTGVGGVPVQGQLFPPIRAQTAPVRDGQRMETMPKILQKRSIFDRIGPGAGIKNAISNPILQEDGERNPLSKIATIDLATAAKNDRERRDNDMATMQRPPSLIAQRPAPQPPVITPEDALKRAQSTKRKEIGPTSPAVEPQPLKSAGLMSNPPATTSSAQLSPGVEEIRRRSPLQMPETVQQNGKEKETRLTTPKQAGSVNSISPPRPPRPERPLSPFETMERTGSQRTLDRSVSQKSGSSVIRTISPSTSLVPPPPPKSAARLMSPKKPDLPSTWPIQSSVDPTIRPSRNKPPSPNTQDGASGSGLQRRPTTAGLPSNPRAMTMRPLPKDAALSQEQTVMFVNNIQYNDPTAVQNIIQGAANQAAKTPLSFQSPGPALKSSGSIVHRPRPIPRQLGKDRQIFPAENTVTHRRSKSGGSIMSRKSILLSNPGSPTQLPPLPPPPKSAGNPVRPLPNDTKSMTFDEKMNLFFPGSSNKSDEGMKHRQSIPEIPNLPAAYKLGSSVIVEDKGGWDTESSHDQSKQSDRSTKTSVRTQSILEIDGPSNHMDYPRNTSKFSIDTSVITGKGFTDEHESWIPDIPTEDRARSGRSYDGAKRQSSPVLPIRNPSLSEFSEARTRDEETTTNWGSIHSPAAAVNIQEVTHMLKPTWIGPRDVSMISHNDGKEVMTIMLDASVEHERELQGSPKRDRAASELDLTVAGGSAPWHRRIGDECVTFSERKEKVNSRRMPPPMPLQLKSFVQKNAVVLQVAEPSPIESPQQAYEMIQAQLKKLEEPNRDSYESQGQRIRLLESLEAEMGQQENQWHEMQHGLSRNSFSTVGTASVRNSQMDSSNLDSNSKEPSQHSNIAADRRASRRARMQSGSSITKSSYEDLRSASSTSSENNNRTSLWQQRLADAQMEYMENATELLAKRNLNFLSVSKARVSAQLGSPTPPDTDESDGGDAQILARLMPKERAAPDGRLWKPLSPVYFERELTLLWAPAPDVATKPLQRGIGVVLPGLSVRPATRKTSEPLTIESTQLWHQDHTAAKKLRNSTFGLWRTSFVASSTPEAPKPQLRPVTQRPPRRSKRITLLPDIIENPVPLPDKRGTLGIFQFPWGEKSDTAIVQPRPSHTFMAMPGTMSTGGPAVRAALEARAKQLESQEYSSSFFDDYDEEEEGDDQVSDLEDDESDDGFDETTLWEIASLLQSDQVPSKNSLLPQPTHYRPDSLVEEDIPQNTLEQTSQDTKTAEMEDDTKHDSMVIAVAVEKLPYPAKPSSMLWTGKPKRFVSVRQLPGLPQPDARTWATYVGTMDAPPRVQSRLPEPAMIHSTSLWSLPAPSLIRKPSGNKLWGLPQQQQQPPSPQSQQQSKSKATLLWAARPAPVETVSDGLFDPSHRRVTFRTTSAPAIGLFMPSTVRITVEALPVLTSSSLWQSQQKPTKSLWTAPVAVVETACEGLFNASHKRATFKRTCAVPVGLSMPSTAHVTKEVLPTLTSTRLWVASSVVLQAHNWISISSIGPSSPSYAAMSGRSTPTLDTASTRSVATEAVSDFDPLPELVVKQPTWWETSTEASSTGEVVPREHLLRTQATAADWELALNEAIGASSTTGHLVRTAASSAQWIEALNEAITASKNVTEVLVEAAEHQLEQHQEQQDFSQPEFEQQPSFERQDLEQQQYEQQEYERRLFEQQQYEQRLFEQQQYNQRLLEQQMYQQQQYYEQQQQQQQQVYEPQYHSQYEPQYEPQYEQQVNSLSEEQQQPFEQQTESEENMKPVEYEQESKPEQEQEQEQEHKSQPEATILFSLWSAPEVTIRKDMGIMWVPPAKSIRHVHDTTPLTPEDSKSRELRLKRSKTQVTNAGPVSFVDQGMWNRFYGAELQRIVPLGGGRNWVMGDAQPRVSKVAFRY
ncbi:uncharacterized protein CTRU02_211045 [Colletotrichum truncatum]|uniref:Uncharacterized protein n=1 Tax=Colletotrichum truncatum TaxID=5467 RepID=A0ACC3YQN2_COLTU